MRLQLPSGLWIQARGWSGAIDTFGDHQPDWGLYLDGGWTSRVNWPSRFVTWPDYGVPSSEDEGDAIAGIEEAERRAAMGERVEVGCTGGTGRTGTALACLAVLGGVDSASAIDWVRSNYHPEAIETPEQERFVDRFADAVSEGPERRDGPPQTTSPDEKEAHSVAVLRRQLMSDLDRWEPELADWRGTRGTLWYGIFDKACKRVDGVISATTRHWLSLAGDAGENVLANVGQKKPLEKLTLGQHLDVLRALNKRGLLTDGCLVPKADLHRVERLVERRNDFEHGRLDYDEHAIELTLAFLADARDLCGSALVVRSSS